MPAEMPNKTLQDTLQNPALSLGQLIPAAAALHKPLRHANPKALPALHAAKILPALQSRGRPHEIADQRRSRGLASASSHEVQGHTAHGRGYQEEGTGEEAGSDEDTEEGPHQGNCKADEEWQVGR